ncbi:MAG: glycoside hydrolase family 3 C-terminal domain-containing protein [Eubacteriales bacterium]|nr:glycoside hydrolase family 3 C-terminal domain-containing protein [Eubacteriales bacterium]
MDKVKKDINKNEVLCNEIRKKAERIVEQMTPEEMVYQTVNSAPPIERLGIKGYDWWNEGLHGVARAGVATVFPQAIGLAATFDEDMVEQVADAVSTEARAKFNMQQNYSDYGRYKGLTMWAPNINIFRDPRWGRGHETYGEDPYLTSRLGVRYVEGLQGHNEHFLKTAACAKHFVGHSGPEGLRHEFDARISKKDLEDTYMPAFEACVKEARVETVMGAYNRINGEPCCGSKTMLIDVLRKKWGFRGHVVSDCFAIRDFHEHHHVTKTPEESAAMAINNGCDLNCGKMFLYLTSAYEHGLISIERLKEAVTNLYTTKLKLGTVDPADMGKNPYNNIPFSIVDSKEMQKLNLRVSEKTMVLLKNKDNILPLNPEKLTTIGIIGPNANSRAALVGNYEGTASRYYTVTEGIQDYLDKNEMNCRVLTSEGCHLYKESWKTNRISEVNAVCHASDVIILCMGLDSTIEGEQGDAGNDFASGDKLNLNLPGEQQQIVEAAVNSGKPVILLYLSGSALTVGSMEDKLSAIMQCWYPGAQGGRAIANILFGKVSPQGHLPVTFYKTTEELPDFTDYSMENRTYRYMKNEALYPFGYGLTYTRFEYSNMMVSTNNEDMSAQITVLVKNTGKFDCTETVQVYVKAPGMDTPNPQLKAFTKVSLKAGEEKVVKMSLTKSAFSLVDDNGERFMPRGSFQIYAGGSQPDIRSINLMGQKPLEYELEFEMM